MNSRKVDDMMQPPEFQEWLNTIDSLENLGDSFPEELLQMGWKAACRHCASQVPTNWCDPLLTGPDRVMPSIPGKITNQHVEQLLLAVKKRINPDKS